MDNLFLILDTHDHDFIDFLIDDGNNSYKRVSFVEENFQGYDQFKIHLIISNSGTRFKRIKVPPVNKSQLNKMIPHLIEDITLGNMSDYHLTFTSRDEDGFLLVSITAKAVIEKCLSLMQGIYLHPKSIIPIESFISSKTNEGFLVSYKDSSFVNYGNKWRWSSDKVTISSLVQEGLSEYGISKMSVYHDGNPKVDFGDVVFQIKHLADFINLNVDNFFFELNLLTGNFLPKVSWNKLIKSWYIVILSVFSIFLLQILNMTISAYKNESLTNNFNNLSIKSYQELYPNEPLTGNTTRQIKKKLKGIEEQGIGRFMDTFLISSEILSNNLDASIFSINFDKENNLFLLEIESPEFENLEEIKREFIDRGFVVETGSSRRSGSSVISEILIRQK
ncbi:MAG: type II secretion system protein GspL [SAR86 cluster bacterium]|nr:type II secretion system protein GspL [SAR86 cluster bacterium]